MPIKILHCIRHPTCHANKAAARLQGLHDAVLVLREHARESIDLQCMRGEVLASSRQHVGLFKRTWHLRQPLAAAVAALSKLPVALASDTATTCLTVPRALLPRVSILQ
jgi:hypothetical protein